MTDRFSCSELTTKINAIKKSWHDFLLELGSGNIEKSLNIKKDLMFRIKEIKREYWSLEILTIKEIERQYDEWQVMYDNQMPNYRMPSKERIIEFLKSDPDFHELMEKKEKQGLTRMILAPAPGYYRLKDWSYAIDPSLDEEKGNKNGTHIWSKIFGDEDDIHYFGTVKDKASRARPTGGATGKEIKQNPDKYGVCDGWLISFTTNEKYIASRDGLDTGNGRKTIKGGRFQEEYQELYFSDKNKTYEGEVAMIPQEHLALFLKDLYEKYIKTHKVITGESNDLIDSDCIMLFISTYSKDEPGLTYVYWHVKDRQLECGVASPGNYIPVSGTRSVVRRELKSE